MNLQSRIVFAFNKFYSSFIRDLKETNAEVKSRIKKNYKVIDKMSEEYIEYYSEQIQDIIDKIVKDDVNALANDNTVVDKSLIKNVSIKLVLDSITNPLDLQVFWNYVYILTLFTLVKKENDESPEEVENADVMFSTVVAILSKIQHGEEYQSLLDDIIDDDIRELVSKIKNVKSDIKIDEAHAHAHAHAHSAGDSSSPAGNPMMQDNLICNLAKEISNEIDVTGLKVDKPEDVLKLMDFSSSNNLVGDIIKKVSGKIHDKINSGEIKQEELFGEAMNMMNMMNMGGGGAGGLGGLGNMAGLFNNPMMTEMMKSMKSGKAVPRQDVLKKASARDRLRTKLEERRKQQDGDGSKQ
jgi:hypothetical protein